MEHDEQYLNTALEAGRIALGNGAESARCDEIMNNILDASDNPDRTTSVILTSISARLGNNTQIRDVKSWKTNLDKVCKADAISRKVASGILDIEEAGRQLKKLDADPDIYGFWLRMIAYVILMASMAVLIDGNLLDCAVAGGCVLIMGFVDSFFRRIRLHAFASITVQVFIIILCGTLAFFLTKGVSNIDTVVIATIIPLFPGLSITNAVRDTLQGDYVSGGGRLMEAFVKALAISVGVTAGLVVAILIAGDMIKETTNALLPAVTDNGAKFLIYAVAAICYCIGFSMLFEVAPRFLFWGALVGCAGKLLSLAMIQGGSSKVLSAFVAMLLIALLAQIVSLIFKSPQIPFLIGGIMTLAPGSALYRSVITIISGDYQAGAKSLVETLCIAGAIAIAIFLVDTVFLTAKRIKRKELFRK